MNTKLNSRIIFTIPLVLYYIINCLFISKYSIRYEINPLISNILYFIFASLAIYFSPVIINVLEKRIKNSYIFISLSIVAGILVLQYSIDPYSLQVDRWSAIHNFIQNLFSGTYPYLAKTHLGGYGSPFPVWQALHIPFYWLGNISLAFVVVFGVLTYTLPLLLNSYKKAFLFMVLLLISPAFWYEVTVRSDLFYNFLLLMIICAYIIKKKLSISGYPIGLGVLCGLMLSTRLSVFAPLAITLFSGFIASATKNKAIFLGITILSFILTFTPLLVWDWNSLLFFQHNPISLQTRQGSVFEVIFLIALAIFFGTRKFKSIQTTFLYISISFCLFITVTFLHRMINSHFVNQLFSSSFDITYYNMALPFLMYFLAGNNFQQSKPEAAL